MFSGIIEAKSLISKVEQLDRAFRVTIQKPIFFNDLKTGDSIATDGVCLTLESFTEHEIIFIIGSETIKVLNRSQIEHWQNRTVNLERSLRFGDRIHGHLVTGHVDSMGRVSELNKSGDCLFITIQIPKEICLYAWKKGSLTINGVSLTINEVRKNEFGAEIEFCLIPETLQRTNLSLLNVGDQVCLEPDYMARAILQATQENMKEVTHGHSVQ